MFEYKCTYGIITVLRCYQPCTVLFRFYTSVTYSILTLFLVILQNCTMGKIRSFVLNLTDNKPVYFPGDEINGQLLLHLDEAMEMKGMSLISLVSLILPKTPKK